MGDPAAAEGGRTDRRTEGGGIYLQNRSTSLPVSLCPPHPRNFQMAAPPHPPLCDGQGEVAAVRAVWHDDDVGPGEYVQG